MVSLVRSTISLASDFWLPANFQDCLTLCLVKFYIKWCWALKRTRCHSYLKCPSTALRVDFLEKLPKLIGSPPNFSKLISHMFQLWGIPQPQYFITLLLDLHWTYFWKDFIYYEKDTKVGSQNIGYQICFCNQTDYGRGLLIFLSFMPLWLSVKLRFPGISQKMLWGNGLKFCMLMYPDHLQNHCF